MIILFLFNHACTCTYKCCFFFSPVPDDSPPGLASSSASRPTVSQFMEELNEVERKVSHERDQPKTAPRPSASTATQELDMLMADLSDFKLPPQAAQTSKPPPPQVSTRE